MGRVMPHDVIAEQAVLGAMLLAGSRIIAGLTDVLRAEDFYGAGHQELYRDLVALHEAGKPPTLPMLLSTVGERVAEMGGTAYVAELADSRATTEDVTHYARIVADKALLRGLILRAGQIQDLAYDADDAIETAQQAEALIFEATAEIHREGHVGGEPVKTGYRDLDALMGPAKPGNVIILAGFTGRGKTALAMNWARNVATGAGQQDPGLVVIFSLEMTAEEMAMRFMAAESGVNLKRIGAGNLTDPEWGALAVAQSECSEWPIYLDDTTDLTVGQMRQRCREVVRARRQPIRLVVVDYLQLVSVPETKGKRQDSRAFDVGKISRGLKLLGGEFRAPVLALSQLSRQGESDKEPDLRHLRESGSIEQDASIVLFVMGELGTFTRVIKIGKNRNGELGRVPMFYTGRNTRFDAYLKGAPGAWRRA